MVGTQTPQFWVGTSGFYYKGWRGYFYPHETKPAGMLSYYASRFPLLELNCTFYRMPTRRMFESMIARTPDGFQFVVKMHASVTHELQLEPLPEFLEAAELLAQHGRLDGLLLQFPERFAYNAANVEHLKRLADRLENFTVFVEYRHGSWLARAPALAAELGLSVVSVDVPAIPSLFPRKIIAASPSVYVRFHSRAADNWYRDGRDRYDYFYSDAELNEWLDEIEDLKETIDSVRLVFNNCRRGQAAANAARVRELIEQRFGPEAVAGRDVLKGASCLMPLFDRKGNENGTGLPHSRTHH